MCKALGFGAGPGFYFILADGIESPNFLAFQFPICVIRMILQ